MSDSTSQSKDEEIDLGQLFNLVGKGFSKVGCVLKSFYAGILHIIKVTLTFFQKHLIKFGIAAIVGMVFGYVIDKSKAPEFEASLVVKPNYESGRQLYKNVAYYDELIKQENFELLAQTFGITTDEAQTLVSFEISPVINENYMLSTYDEFLRSIDSTIALNFEYAQYTENFEDYKFSEHEILVTSTSNNIFIKLENVIISGVRSNDYFQKLEESEREILKRNEAYLQATLNEVDTLRKVYTEVLIKESEKEVSQGTNINMASGKESNKELSLFAEENRVNTEIDHLTRTKVRNIEIINVISSFQKIGFRVDGIVKKWMFRLGGLFLIGMFFFALAMDIKAKP